jgi:hypothetical protein
MKRSWRAGESLLQGMEGELMSVYTIKLIFDGNIA